MSQIRGPAPFVSGKIKPPSGITNKDNIIFSFAYFDASDSQVNCTESEKEYFHTLFDRLKAVGQMKVSSFKTLHAIRYSPLRAHPIDWNHKKNIKKGFGIPQREDFDAVGWQFSVSKSKHGRVHGFLIDTVFHIVWLDPQHRLYPWD